MALETLKNEIDSGNNLIKIIAKLDQLIDILSKGIPIPSGQLSPTSNSGPMTTLGRSAVGQNFLELSNGGTQFPVTAPGSGSFAILGVGTGGTPTISLGGISITLTTSPIASQQLFLTEFPVSSGWAIEDITGITVLGVFFIEGN